MSKVIYIEGTQDVDNGNLRSAFARLFEKDLKGRMPHVIMGNGKNQTIDKFHSAPLKPGEERFLLIDSDSMIEDKKEVCNQFNGKKINRKQSCTTENTYFMIQESEAWILSQPEILKKHKINVDKLPKRNVMEIEKPSSLMAMLYKDSGKEYHKVRDFSCLLPDLDTQALSDYFDEYKKLIASLKS